MSVLWNVYFRNDNATDADSMFIPSVFNLLYLSWLVHIQASLQYLCRYIMVYIIHASFNLYHHSYRSISLIYHAYAASFMHHSWIVHAPSILLHHMCTYTDTSTYIPFHTMHCAISCNVPFFCFNTMGCFAPKRFLNMSWAIMNTFGMAVDSDLGKLYMADFEKTGQFTGRSTDYSGRIIRTNLDGSEAEARWTVNHPVIPVLGVDAICKN